MNTFTTFDVKDAEVRIVWDTDTILNPQASLVLSIQTNDHTTVTIHGKRADMERIYTALDKFLDSAHKAEQDEREREMYASTLFDVANDN